MEAERTRAWAPVAEAKARAFAAFDAGEWSDAGEWFEQAWGEVFSLQRQLADLRESDRFGMHYVNLLYVLTPHLPVGGFAQELASLEWWHAVCFDRWQRARIPALLRLRAALADHDPILFHETNLSRQLVLPPARKAA